MAIPYVTTGGITCLAWDEDQAELYDAFGWTRQEGD